MAQRQLGASLEEVPGCLLCGSGSLRPSPEQPHPPYGLLECPACSAILLSPRPQAEAMKAFYSRIAGGQRDLPLDPRQLRRAQRHLRRLSRHRRPPGRMLEVGAGEGYFCSAAREAGWEVVGLDVAYPHAARARQLFGLEVRVGDLLSADLRPASFDVVCLFQTLEHLHEPRVFLARVGELLRPNGLLALSTPNVLSYPGKGRGVAEGWLIPQHVLFYTPLSLLRFLKAMHFRCCQPRIVWAATLEERMCWRPWRDGGSALSRRLRDWLTPFGLFVLARKG